jgi:hypothetical protein
MNPFRSTVGLLSLGLAQLGCTEAPSQQPANAAQAGASSGNGGAPSGAGGVSAASGTSTLGTAGAELGGSGGAAAAATGGSAGGAHVNGGAGGAGGSGGSTGASGAAGSSGSGSCAGLFCEDFEQGQLDPAKWDTVTGMGGSVEVQTQTIAHGKYALHVHGLAGPNADYALIVSKHAPEALSGTHYGRAAFMITPKPLTSGHTQMVFAGTNGSGPANGPGPFPKLRYMEVANIGGGWQIGFDLLDISPLIEEVLYPAGSPQVPVTVFSCLEWQFSDLPDSASLWVDGKPLGTFDDQHVSYPSNHSGPLYDGKSSGLIGGFSSFGFGFHDWHPNKPFDLYYDDIVLDVKRVGCPAP